ncbi:hypothetical protein [Micromonospora sp. NPDC047074]|uniref:hypothetical protein n=1 Tax=Micromonospora sp. NPDC047074 TaxID=3154339 RepID=UPI003411B465
MHEQPGRLTGDPASPPRVGTPGVGMPDPGVDRAADPGVDAGDDAAPADDAAPDGGRRDPYQPL